MRRASRSRRSTICAPTPTPWRSDEMIAAMQAAIDRYQHLVSIGGWPSCRRAA